MTGALLNITPLPSSTGEGIFEGHREPFTYRLVEERAVAAEVSAPVRRGGFGAALAASSRGAAFKLFAFGVGFFAMIFNFVAGVVMVISLILAAMVLLLCLLTHVWVWHLWLFLGLAFSLYVAIGLLTIVSDRLKRAAGLVA